MVYSSYYLIKQIFFLNYKLISHLFLFAVFLSQKNSFSKIKHHCLILIFSLNINSYKIIFFDSVSVSFSCILAIWPSTVFHYISKKIVLVLECWRIQIAQKIQLSKYVANVPYSVNADKKNGCCDQRRWRPTPNPYVAPFVTGVMYTKRVLYIF